METHILLLKSKCRACNGSIKNKKSYPILRWSKTIKCIYDVDVTTDHVTIHPTKVCLSCRTVFDRLQKAMDNNKETSTSLAMHSFTPHDEQCSLCFPTEDARIVEYRIKRSKQKKGRVGRGKRGAFRVTSSATSDAAVNDETQSDVSDVHKYLARHGNNLNLTKNKKTFSDHSVRTSGPCLWNALEKSLKTLKSVKHFCKHFKQKLIFKL